MGRETLIKSDWPIHDEKGNIEPERAVKVSFARSYNKHFLKTEDMYISAGLLKKLIKEHGIKPKWKEYVEKTTPQGVVIKTPDGKTVKEFVDVTPEYIDNLVSGDLNSKGQ